MAFRGTLHDQLLAQALDLAFELLNLLNVRTAIVLVASLARSCSIIVLVALLAEHLQFILFAGICLFNLGQPVTEADVVVGAARNLKRLGPIKGCDLSWLRGVILGLRSSGRRLVQLPTQLRELVGSPREQLVVFREHDTVLQAAVDALHCFRQRAL